MVGNTLKKEFLPVYRTIDQIIDLSLTLTRVTDILFEKLTLQIGDWILKTPSVHYACGVGGFMQNLSSFIKKLLVVTGSYIYVFTGQSHGEVS